MIYDIIDNAVSDDINQYILNILQNSAWYYTGKEPFQDQNTDTSMAGGMINQSYFRTGKWDENRYNVILNSVATFILEQCLKKSSWLFTGIEVDRIFWNYYYPNSGVLSHQDFPCKVVSSEDLYMSMIYHLNTNKGYNTVCGEKIDTVEGRCILFQNTDFHEAYNPIESEERFTLNIVFSYSGGSISKNPIETLDNL